MYYVYFLQSTKDGKFYIGQTAKNPKIRLDEHNAGFSRWTNQHRPFRLIYYEAFHCREDAEERERFYKLGIGKELRKVILNYIVSKGQ